MSYQFNFQLENAAATDKAVVYTGESNTLRLSITNTASVWNVVSGSTVPTNEDALMSSVPSCTVLYLEIGSLITVGSVTAPTGWKAEVISEKSGSKAIGIIPTADANIANEQTLTFTLNDVTTIQKPAPLSITLNGYGLEQSNMLNSVAYSDAPLAIMNSPKLMVAKTLPLLCNVLNNKIIVEDNITSPELILYIAVPPSGEPLSADGAWVKSGAKPTISISLIPGSGNGALASKQKLKNITVNLPSEQTSMWTIVPNVEANVPCWDLIATATNKHILSPSEPLQITLGNIMSDNTVVPGETWLTVMASNVPGYNDRTFFQSIDKIAPTPSILGFSADQTHIVAGQKVRLSWSTYDMAYVELTYTNNNEQVITKNSQTGTDSLIVEPEVNPSNVYTLNATDSNNIKYQKVVTIQLLQNEIISLQPENGKYEVNYGDTVTIIAHTVGVNKVKLFSSGIPISLQCDAIPGRPGLYATHKIIAKKSETFMIEVSSGAVQGSGISLPIVVFPTIENFSCTISSFTYGMGFSTLPILSWGAISADTTLLQIFQNGVCIAGLLPANGGFKIGPGSYSVPWLTLDRILPSQTNGLQVRYDLYAFVNSSIHTKKTVFITAKGSVFM
jgi:hypothetical protein